MLSMFNYTYTEIDTYHINTVQMSEMHFYILIFNIKFKTCLMCLIVVFYHIFKDKNLVFSFRQPLFSKINEFFANSFVQSQRQI